ncbi:MAG: TonB-dependent receptor, partial [Saprospiraceae bacterium]|nr:TonB-dependent receptor [Saprospiraceae bacterium]
MLLRFIYLLVLCIGTIFLNAQKDTSYLKYDQLHWSDIENVDLNKAVTKVIAGTRTEQNLEDLPFTVFVISGQEIREHGYHTLVDALKHLPGIRVSQPGSGLDGESFMMRGLYGNTYAKILINDVPVRPSVVGAMPIGSQLPIRQAERIEVIYGPAATLYGADAASGIINIILKDSEYPTFAQADIEVGDDNLTRLTAMFGGKFALGKKTIKIKMYGGYTSFNDREVKYDLNNLYNPQQYENVLGLNAQDIIQYEDRPNYIGTTGSTFLSALPHLSNYAGFTASLGAIELTAQRMFRADHSSIGLNPFAVSYADPQSLMGEEIISNSIVIRKEYMKWDFSLRFNSLYYSITPLSSYKYVLPQFGTVVNAFALGFLGDTGTSPMMNIPQLVDSLYLSGSRYVASTFNDFSIEFQANIRINENISLSTGLQTQGGTGGGIERFRPFPKNTLTGVILPDILVNPSASFSSITSFMEGYIKFGSFSAIGGIQFFLRSDDLESDEIVFNPRFGLLYKITPALSLRASYSQAFRYPSAFFNNSSYTLTVQDDSFNIQIGSQNLEAEQTINLETGIRFTPSKDISLDASIYYMKTTNFINFDVNNKGTDPLIFWGYNNDPGSFNKLTGGQISLSVRNLIPAIKLGTEVNLNYSQGKERILQVDFENSAERQLQDLPVIRAHPAFIGHIRMSIEPVKNLSFFLDHSFMTNSWTRNMLRITNAIANNSLEQLENKGYYTLDIRSLFKISRQL